jgi:hypothetical protein
VEGLRHALEEIGDHDGYRGMLVAALAPYLPGESLGDALTALETVNRPHRALEALAERFPEDQLGQLIAFAQARMPSGEFVRIIAARLPWQQMDAVLQLCQAVPQPEERAKALTAIARHLDAETARRLLAPGSEPDLPGFAVIEFLGLSLVNEEEYQLLPVGALLDRLPEDEARALVSERVLPLITQNARRRVYPASRWK